jgi:hypothetical protein
MLTAKMKTDFFDLSVDGLTASSINTFLKCKPEFKLKYQEGYSSKTISDSIIFGNYVHHILEHAYKSKRLLVQEEIKELINKYLPDASYDATKSPTLDTESYAALEEVRIKAEHTLVWYFLQYGIDFTKEIKSTEETFIVYYRDIPIRGKMDLIFEDHTIIDHKCKGKWSLFNLETLLPKNIQVNLYCWAYWKLHGKVPTFKLNLIRNPSLTSKDRLELVKKLTKDIPERLTHYFHRISYTPSENEIQNWELNVLDKIINQVIFYLSSSDFDLCADFQLENNFNLSPYAEAIINNDYSGLRKRKYVHEELFI